MSNLEMIKRTSRNAESDECYTPVNQVSPLLEYLDKGKTYYEATSGKSSAILDGFSEAGYNMVGSQGKDFFDCEPDDVYDGDHHKSTI